MERCTICRLKLNERRDVRYCAGTLTFCSPACVVAWREKTGAW